MKDEPQPQKRHIPVMPEEVLSWLRIEPGDTVVDGTVGLGGHAELFLTHTAPGGTLIGLDQDHAALALARERLAIFGERVTLFHARYSDTKAVLARHGMPNVQKILLDLGVSSLQLEQPQRGFSFRRDGPLDMRMDNTQHLDAKEIVNRYSESELADIFYCFGEERFSRRIAKEIAERRKRATINTTGELAAAVRAAVPRRGRIDPSTRVFQALRIAVNDELGELERGLPAVLTALAPRGRLAVLAFHSLEDRIVKQTFAGWEREGVARRLHKRVIKPGREECRRNRRARSAKLRVCEATTDTDKEAGCA